MTTLAEIERSLPWGFHDGHLEQLSIDYLGRTLTLVRDCRSRSTKTSNDAHAS